ncbi:hypothetical protein JF531_08200 [Microbacterium esteraromaticum]|uniref:hypothetical protein n=1 Tax=Microbacterium esteraromaticum TaxID=57043 RepID=UPI001A900477|nr:hypothetical protein [Microbacterium esteraromaticum]MBN8424499.1 hypothetical protein [Microbacterium esteraromaticum]
MGVKVNYDQLGNLSTQLKSVVDEFEHAGSRANDLQDDVGRPYGESELRDLAGDFEGRWDDRRKSLMESCKAVAEYVDDVLEAFKDFDQDAASKFDEKGGQ